MITRCEPKRPSRKRTLDNWGEYVIFLVFCLVTTGATAGCAKTEKEKAMGASSARREGATTQARKKEPKDTTNAKPMEATGDKRADADGNERAESSAPAATLPPADVAAALKKNETTRLMIKALLDGSGHQKDMGRQQPEDKEMEWIFGTNGLSTAAHLDLADGYAQKKEWDKALLALKKTESAIFSGDDPFDKAEYLSFLAVIHAHRGERAKEEETVAKLKSIASTRGFGKTAALELLAFKHGNYGDVEKMRTILEEALRVAREEGDTSAEKRLTRQLESMRLLQDAVNKRKKTPANK